MDEIAEEAEHQEYMDTLRRLERQVFLAYSAQPMDVLVDQWNDIRTYGDEPAFGSLIGDKVIEEAYGSDE